MNKPFLLIANWKMSFDLNQSLNFVRNNYGQLTILAESDSKLVLCPSMPALYGLSIQLKNTNISVGAQDCSHEKQGAFTGQVSAQHLKTAGATYCIIGHSERRMYNYETNEEIAQKSLRLLEQEITPIMCIGESLDQYKAGTAFNVLEEQLKSVFDIINSHTELVKNISFCIAYEPIWAIGRGVIPQSNDLIKIFGWLHEKTKEINKSIDWKLLYGGSVKSNNVAQLKKIEGIDGFLIGGASLDFQELEKIVHCNLNLTNR